MISTEVALYCVRTVFHQQEPLDMDSSRAILLMIMLVADYIEIWMKGLLLRRQEEQLVKILKEKAELELVQEKNLRKDSLEAFRKGPEVEIQNAKPPVRQEATEKVDKLKEIDVEQMI